VKIVLALAAVGGCAVMVFYAEYFRAVECEADPCSATSGPGVMRAAAWMALGGTIAAIVLRRLRVWWGVAAAAAFTGVMFLLWLLLFSAATGNL
jgi:hypothetical protein